MKEKRRIYKSQTNKKQGKYNSVYGALHSTETNMAHNRTSNLDNKTYIPISPVLISLLSFHLYLGLSCLSRFLAKILYWLFTPPIRVRVHATFSFDNFNIIRWRTRTPWPTCILLLLYLYTRIYRSYKNVIFFHRKCIHTKD